MDKTKSGENVPSLGVAKVVLVQCNLVDNQYQRKPKVLYSFTTNKSNAYLLNIEQSNLVLLKTYNNEFNNITITFTDQNSGALKIEDKVNLTLLINNRNGMLLYRIKKKKYFKGYGIWSFRRNVSSKYGRQLLIAGAKAGLNTWKTVAKTVAHKADEATGEFIGNIVDKIKTCT